MKEEPTVFRINGLWVSYAHTICAGSAFFFALVVGCLLHFEKIVTNEFYSYPDEWFPSVSATIGDRYPERSVYQLLIALTSGPRFLMVFLTFLMANRPSSKLPLILLLVGVLRTFTCGGWTYITSTDDHDWHDIFMISYIVLTLPWMVLATITSRPQSSARKYRRNVGITFFSMLVPLIYLFVQHKVHRVAGAYTKYAFCEWSLIILDIAFDAGTAYDFEGLDIVVKDPANVVQKSTSIEILHNPSVLKQGPGYFWFVVSCVNWLIFWSVLTSLGVLIWYFPLWFMGISGYEALLLAFLVVVVLGVGPVRRVLAKWPQLAWLGQALGGVGAYWVKEPTKRVFFVAAGCGFGALAIAVTISNATRPGARPGSIQAQSAAFVIGLLLSATLKMAWWGNNPIWPVMNIETDGLNWWGLALGIGAAVCTTPSSIDSQPISRAGESSLFAGAAIGALLFVLNTYLSDTSLLPIWVWDGFPVRGPTPVPHGLVTLAVAAAGLRTGLTRRKAVLSKRWMMIFCFGMTLLCTMSQWIGYTGGLVVVFYSIAVTPALLEAAGRQPVGRTWTAAMVTMCGFMLAETWTVAYAFVPGGFLLRERTWAVMFVEALLLLAGVFNARKITASENTKKAKSAFKPSNVTAALRKVVYATTVALAITLTASSLVTFRRMQRTVPQPVHPNEKAITAGIWTVHFGLDNDMWVSEKRVRDLIADAELDVIGLLESDTQRIIGGHRDMTQLIAEELGFYVDYGPGPNKHTWGAALLSRFPVLNSTHHLTPSPHGELAPAIHATLDVYGTPVDVVVFHSGQEEDVEDRHLQTQYVSSLLAASPRPAILLAYLVTQPSNGNYNTWVSSYTGMHDIDPSDWDRWCEYILYKGLRRTAYARISRSTITDTELQVARFTLDKPNYDSGLIDESAVPQGLRMPSCFRDGGVRGHFYHVFDEPRYFG